MGSLLPGYEYDIFISYRQKDNRYDGWVTEFVENLKMELESTFKEDISVYFDINPHDGLLETHDVSASLKDKLKCLVFIPVLSRTYCDPNSFAWEHEFKSFIEQASIDKYGLKIKLPNGNVVSRLLPVVIHDLDRNDKELCESILGGVLRGIEFIYREAGVNRPLKPDDDTSINLNKTKYRNQVNKVALAVKEIFTGLSADPGIPGDKKSEVKELIKVHKTDNSRQELQRYVKKLPVKALAGVVLLTALVFAAIFVWPDFFKRNTIESLRSSGERISVAVMPFQNMTNDTTWNVWQEGIQDILITFLANSEELRVRQPESVKSVLQGKDFAGYESITPSVASAVSKKLEADVYISGNIKRAGNTLRIYAQLVNSGTEEVFKSFQIEAENEEAKVFQIIDSLSREITDFLIVTELKRGRSHESQVMVATNSPEAYRYFMQGESFFSRLDYSSAIKLFSKALALDSNFFVAVLYTSLSYGNQGLFEPAKDWCLTAYNKRDLMPVRQKLYTEWLYANYFETPYEEITILRRLIDVDDQAPRPYYLMGLSYSSLRQYEKAIPEYLEAIKIRNKWGLKQGWIYDYTGLGEAYHETGRFRKEKRLYEKAKLDFPDDPKLLYRQAVLALSAGRIKAANKYLEKYKTTLRNKKVSEAELSVNLADIYAEAGLFDMAVGYYNDALSSEPENHRWLNSFAYLIIDNDLDISKGMELIERALKLKPDNYNYLDTKGWGLYKQQKYQESLEMLEKSWSLKPIYNHTIHLHLQEAKKAVASQKSSSTPLVLKGYKLQYHGCNHGY